MLGLESPSEIEQQATGRGDVCAAVGPLQDRLRLRPSALWQVIEDVAHLVDLAALHQRDVAEEIPHGFSQRLRAVEDHQQTAVRAEAAALEIGQQRLAERRVLRGAFPQPEGVFLAVRRDPQRHDQAVLADVDAVENQPDQVAGIERL